MVLLMKLMFRIAALSLFCPLNALSCVFKFYTIGIIIQKMFVNYHRLEIDILKNKSEVAVDIISNISNEFLVKTKENDETQKIEVKEHGEEDDSLPQLRSKSR